MFVFGRVATLVLSATLAAGCSSTVSTVTSYDVLFRTGVPSEFSFAAAGGEMPVAVIGNPFGMPQADLDAKVIAAMQGRNYGARVRFVPAEGESRYTGYRVVMLLDALGGARGDTACAFRPIAHASEGGEQPAPTPVPVPPPAPVSTGRTTLMAAFCGGSDARSWAYSTTGPVASPDDPLFRQLVSRTTLAMLPPRDDQYDNQDFD
jgi:hypothetical protein